MTIFAGEAADMRAPKYSLRFALVAVGIFGVAIALLTKQQRVATRLRGHNVRIEYRYQYKNWSDLDRYSYKNDAELSSIGKFFGPDLSSTIVSISASEIENPSDVARLASHLKHLRHIAIQDTSLGDQDLRYFVDLPKLRVLHLRGTALTDTSVETFSQMPALGVLNIRNTRLSDAAIESLRRALPNTRIHTGPASGGFM